ncbi:mitochondrial import receptor subunit tom20 [Malassezia sp. CBS 17886]|nr:mitochondrial import receptor subunit tom20 [Malassezia sp. CBS 17886]
MKLSTALSFSGVTLAVATVGYAVYFDYRRRNDPHFRKQLRKQAKQSSRAERHQQKAAEAEESRQIEEAVDTLTAPGVLPEGIQEKEAFFMEQVAAGEALFAQGPSFHVPAAIAFFKALKVYPAPVELVMIYQKAVPKDVFDLIMRLVTRDAARHGATEVGKDGGGPDADEHAKIATKNVEVAVEAAASAQEKHVHTEEESAAGLTAKANANVAKTEAAEGVTASKNTGKPADASPEASH